LRLRLDNGENRLQAIAQGSTVVGADQRHRHVAVPAKLRPAGPDVRFSPLSQLDPDFKFLEPIEHIVRSSEILIYLITAIVMVALTVMIKFTRVGKAMRATSQDRDMAMLVGVNVDRVISMTFIIGSATAAIGGILIASHIGQINYYIGFLAGIKAFVAAVMGGIGSMPGAVLGSLVLGWSESFFTGYISSDYEDVFAFLFLVLILIFRPSGLLGRKDTDKV
jgi:branched-chain amino acid transport system permease protein